MSGDAPMLDPEGVVSRGSRLILYVLLSPLLSSVIAGPAGNPSRQQTSGRVERTVVGIFLCGDLMTGRGIDQVLPHSVDPFLEEPYVKDARVYVDLAERRNGPLPEAIGFDYIWGDALPELQRLAPDVRIVNLETAVTAGGKPWMGKGIHYRMHPDNVRVLTQPGIDVVVLANNHVLDWGYEGLSETLATLSEAGLKTVGAGRDRWSAGQPAEVACRDSTRVLVLAFGVTSSGIPLDWSAHDDHPGVAVLPDLSDQAVDRIARSVGQVRRQGDIVVVSLHWGGNWGYRIADDEIVFARRLVDEARVDIVHGHSSHHPRGFEVYRDRLILYGCGDLLNDYEGIAGREDYRPDLSLMYFVQFDARKRRVVGLRLAPMQIRQFRLNSVSPQDARWLEQRLNRECRPFGVRVSLEADGILLAHWR